MYIVWILIILCMDVSAALGVREEAQESLSEKILQASVTCVRVVVSAEQEVMAHQKGFDEVLDSIQKMSCTPLVKLRYIESFVQRVYKQIDNLDNLEGFFTNFHINDLGKHTVDADLEAGIVDQERELMRLCAQHGHVVEVMDTTLKNCIAALLKGVAQNKVALLVCEWWAWRPCFTQEYIDQISVSVEILSMDKAWGTCWVRKPEPGGALEQWKSLFADLYKRCGQERKVFVDSFFYICISNPKGCYDALSSALCPRDEFGLKLLVWLRESQHKIWGHCSETLCQGMGGVQGLQRQGDLFRNIFFVSNEMFALLEGR